MIRKHSITDAIITQIMTRGIANRILPIMPLIIIKGKNADIVVNDEDITGTNIRLAPPSAACNAPSPL